MLKPHACGAMTITGDRFSGPRNASRGGTGLCWLHIRKRGLLGQKKKRRNTAIGIIHRDCTWTGAGAYAELFLRPVRVFGTAAK